MELKLKKINFSRSNFTKFVARVLENHSTDAIILQAGSIEITNIDVKKAPMDPNKSIEEYKHEWTLKVKEDSTNLFNLAKSALKLQPNLKVIIVKRLPRYDTKTQDPIYIKQSLSEFGNSVYDQLWLENGGPKNIKTVSFDNFESFGYLKDIYMGKTNDPHYDGIHLRGWAASRHFTYRAVNAVKTVFAVPRNGFFTRDYHSTCPQFQYQNKQQLS